MAGMQDYFAARNAVMQTGERRREERRLEDQMGVRRQAGNALASGDLSGASNALFQGGDLEAGLAVDSAARTRETNTRDRQRSALAAAASGLLYVPESQRAAMFQNTIAARLIAEGVPQEVVSQITPELLTDAQLRGFVASMGGEVQNAPAGYQWDGAGMRYIPGGPEDPANQRWQITPYGALPPPGWQPPAGQMPQAPRSLGSSIPQGWSTEPPRPNQPPSARPAAGGGERSQPVSVSFRSSQQARQSIAQIVPGVTFTSGRRSPADNARVQGARGSFHLQDRAWDLVPPRGMSMAQLASKMRQQGFRVLNEGDHVHVSW